MTRLGRGINQALVLLRFLQCVSEKKELTLGFSCFDSAVLIL